MVRTRVPSDWDIGDDSFVHTLHRFVYKNFDLFPMFFVSNQTSMKKIWYRVRKTPAPCKCCSGLNPSKGKSTNANVHGGPGK